MQDETKERWKTLCEQAATEEDSRKLVQSVQEINDLPEEKQARLRKKVADERRGDELIAQRDTP